jgi:ABC-2 type transport system ATP-binding protein
MENIIEFHAVRKRYKGFALKGVSFDVPRGYIMGLIGPNGAGKTTLMKMVMNLVRRDGGEVRAFGLDCARDEVRVKARIGYVPDEPACHEDMRLATIASAIAPFYERWDMNRFRGLAGEFGLPLGKRWKTLSQGMKTKFSLALALCHDAELILLDEPTSGLDPVFRRELLERLSAIIQDERRSVLFSTHITADLERIADYITFIRAGEVVFSAPKDEVLERWAIARGGEELLDPGLKPLFRAVRRGPHGVEALTADAAEARRRLNSHAVVERATLDDIMVLMEKGDPS